MKLSATRLRGELYQVLDRLLETGEPVEIERPTGTVVLTRAPRKRGRSTTRKAPSNPDLVVGSPDDLVHFDWSKHWKPFL